MPKRILVVDDSPESRLLVKMWMDSREEECEIVGFACDGVEALSLTASLLPDAIIMDSKMPRMDGVDATRLIKQNFPQIEIVGLSADDQVDTEMLDAGASATFPKDEPTRALDHLDC